MKPSDLESRIATLRGQVRRLLALHGVSWVIGLVVPVVIVLGLADWLIHLDPAVRLIELLALAGFGTWLIYRYVITPLVVRFADLDIALRIEQRWPGLNDRLASTLQFLHLAIDENRFGSATLREATIVQTLEETRTIDFREVIERRPALKALGLAATALMAGVLIFAAAPGLSRIALRRLFLPYGPDRWPQQTHLTLLDRETPRIVARGEPFAMAVTVGKGERAPDSARATYRFDDGETVSEALRAEEGGIFRGRIEAVTRPFTFSVAAGDDHTSIRNVAVRVVPPPAVKELTLKLIAPAYTELPPQTLAPGNTQVRAVEGTRVEVTALANKPIKVATLRLGEAPSGDRVALDRERTRLSTQFTVRDSGPFWFELLDTEGFKNREAVRYEVRASKDEAPRVVIDEPPNDRDVPPNATVPVVFTIDDDYGIQSARLLYKTATGGSEPTPLVALPLWDSKDVPAGRPVKHQEVRYSWDLSSLKLAPGSIVTFHAEARDFDNLKGPNLGKSRELRLRIVSDEEIAHQLDDQRREIREETARILSMQKQAQTPVEEALRTLARTDRVGPPEREELKNAELIQRQVGNRITSKSDGLDQKIRRFLDDLRNFKVENADARKQMEEMRAGVDRIRENHLGPAEQGLSHASKNLDEAEAQVPKTESTPAGGQQQAEQRDRANAPSNPRAPARKEAAKPSKGASPPQPKNQDRSPASSKPSSPENRPAEQGEPKERFTESARAELKESQENQKAIAGELQKMLDSMSEFETYRGVVKDAQDVLKKHEQTMKQTAEAAGKPDLMGKTLDELSPEQKAELANLGARQSNVARGLQGLQERMNEMAGKLEETDPLAAGAMREAAEQSRKQGTSAKMGDAADRMEKNQMGQARSAQEQARRELKDLIDSIQNRRERELARLVKELKNAEAELAKLRERQTQNLKKTQEARKNPDAKQRADQLKKLAKEQQEIRNELKKQLKKLAKLNLERAVQAGERAAGRMGNAEQDLDQDQGEEAGKDQEEALADLEDAEDQIREARREREEQLAMEELLKMGDQLKSLAQRQDKMVGDISGYDTLRAQKQGKLTIAQRTGVRDLGQVQSGLKDETGELIEKLEGAPVFALTLRRAGEKMDETSQRLHSLQTDEETQRAARSAANRFKQLIDALRADKKGGAQQARNGQEGGGGAGGGAGDGIPPEAQVKMLKALQEEINERTDFFDELRRRNRELTPSQIAELERLEADQGTLADLARDLTKPKKDDGED